MYKLALAATVFVDGDFESAGRADVANEFVMELAGCNFFDLLDRRDSVLARYINSNSSYKNTSISYGMYSSRESNSLI